MGCCSSVAFDKYLDREIVIPICFGVGNEGEVQHIKDFRTVGILVS